MVSFIKRSQLDLIRSRYGIIHKKVTIRSRYGVIHKKVTKVTIRSRQCHS